MGWSEEAEGEEIFASRSGATGWKDLGGWQNRRSPVLPSVRASPPYLVSDGDPVPTDDSHIYFY